MKQLIQYLCGCLLLLAMTYCLPACSNEVLIGGERPAGRIPVEGTTLAMTVKVAPRSGDADTGSGAGDPAEDAINSLYVFVYNIGTSEYCEAQSFTAYDLVEKDGNYTFQMKVTPGYKRFYLVANPRTDFSRDLASYTQEDLQSLKMYKLGDHNEPEEDIISKDEIQQKLATKGLPMALSVTGNINLTGTAGKGLSGTPDSLEDGEIKGELVLDGSGGNTFTFERAVAKVTLICRVSPLVGNTSLDLVTLEILKANRETYLFPKYIVSDNQWTMDWASMAEGADLSRTVRYQYGKQENNTGTEWVVYDRGTHYLYENYYGTTLSGDKQEGLIDETKYSLIHIVLTDGRDKTFPMSYLRRNDHVTVTLNILPSRIVCDIRPWSEEVIYPDYTEN